MSTINRRHVSIITRGLVLAAASVSIAACSSTVDRFANFTGTNTASVPKTAATAPVKKTRLSGAPAQGTVRPSWQQPSYASTPRATTTPRKVAYAQPAQNGYLTVQSGQTMYSLAKANSMSVNRLAAANNISYPYILKVGQRLKVPGTATPNSPSPTFTAQNQTPKYRATNAPAPAPRANYSSGLAHTVKPGETLFSLGRTYSQNPYSIAKYNGLAAPYALNVGQVVKIPGKSSGYKTAYKAPAPKSVPFKRKRIEIVPKTDDRLVRAPVVPVPVQRNQSELVPNQSLASTFRWPVKGRVISSFGRKPNGLRNEGINIAVPTGTSVRAAESGVVAYAGNELKGYGNLVLVRHKNGWVTAYAHNSELFVKRGDTVKRGTVIAKAGQTGSVKSPQLHFEVRKGASAVDPMKYLTSRNASLN